MAIQTKDPTVATAWNMRVRFPRKRCTCRVLEEEFKPSKKGHLMIERKLEIVLPESLNIDGVVYDIAGQEVQQYRMLRIVDQVTKEIDTVKSKKAINAFLEERGNLGLPAEEVDDEAPPQDLTGMLVDAVISSQESEYREEPTPEQKARGEAGSEIKGADGKAIKIYRLQVEQILGRSTAEVNQAY